MTEEIARRTFMGAVGAATVAAGTPIGAAATEMAAAPSKRMRVVGISCSPRKGKTTAAALKVCLDAVKEANPAIETELVELAGMNIGVYDPAAAAERQGDFLKLVPLLSDPAVAGIVIGTPVYFSGMSSLCKAFLDHCMVFRQKSFALRNKVAGIIAVGSNRNGGQEVTLEAVRASLFCHEMIIVGNGQPAPRAGGTVVNSGDDISGDEFGLSTVKSLGRRIAEVAALVAR
jgi:multimeric flavodoxin WrbA